MHAPTPPAARRRRRRAAALYEAPVSCCGFREVRADDAWWHPRGRLRSRTASSAFNRVSVWWLEWPQGHWNEARVTPCAVGWPTVGIGRLVPPTGASERRSPEASVAVRGRCTPPSCSPAQRMLLPRRSPRPLIQRCDFSECMYARVCSAML